MTYMRRNALRRYAQPKRTGMGNFLDDILGIGPVVDAVSNAQQGQCLDQANAAVAPFDARITDLVKNWQPTGFYTAQDIRDLVNSTMTLVAQGQAAVNLAAHEPTASIDSLMRATDDLATAGKRSLDYLDAAKTAEQQGMRVINAPGFKRWVTDTMAASSSALVTAAVVGCITPWWVGALAAYQAAFDSLVTVAKRVVGAVIALGDKLLTVAEGAPELLEYLKWGAIAAVVYVVYGQVKKGMHHLERT